MWSIGIGPIDLAALLISGMLVLFTKGSARRWAVAILGFLMLGIVLTPADPLSTLIFAGSWIAASVVAVTAASSVRRRRG